MGGLISASDSGCSSGAWAAGQAARGRHRGQDSPWTLLLPGGPPWVPGHHPGQALPPEEVGALPGVRLQPAHGQVEGEAAGGSPPPAAQEGQLVGNVDPGSPALQAGVKKGDRIIEVRGRAACSNPLVSFP